METVAKLIVAGKETDAQSGETIDTVNPATGATLAKLPRAARADVDLAVRAAEAGFAAWQKVGAIERGKVLWRVGEVIMRRLDELAQLESLDGGKPIASARLADVPMSAETFWYFAGWTTKLEGSTVPVKGPYLNYTVHEPLGVVGAITPWNYPLLLASRKVAAALAAGNAVVLKPAEQASLAAIELGKILLEAGAPPGVLNVVTGLGEEAGAALVEHPGVAKISFTGGTATGKLVMASAAKTLKRVSLELGGKSPNIVFADAELDTAIPGAMRAAFVNQGEICTAGSRLLVERSVHDRFVERLVDAAKAWRVGDPLDPKTQMGPLITAEHKGVVTKYFDTAEAEGGRRLCGGARSGPGFFVEPTIYGGITSEMTLAREEVFGPVLAVIPFDGVDEAARVANGTDFGLAAGVWTRDVGRAHALAARIKAGTVWINAFHLFDPASPYGGYRQSGFGRENGAEGLREYTQVKSVWVALGS